MVIVLGPVGGNVLARLFVPEVVELVAYAVAARADRVKLFNHPYNLLRDCTFEACEHQGVNLGEVVLVAEVSEVTSKVGVVGITLEHYLQAVELILERNGCADDVVALGMKAWHCQHHSQQCKKKRFNLLHTSLCLIRLIMFDWLVVFHVLLSPLTGIYSTNLHIYFIHYPKRRYILLLILL